MTTPGMVYGDGFAVLPDAILYAPGVSANAKLLWAVFARHADVAGRCYPGRKRLAELLDVSEDTIKRAKKELADARMISCRERFDDAGRRTTDDVFLHHARRTLAPTGGGKFAPTNSKEVELEPEEQTPRPRGQKAPRAPEPDPGPPVPFFNPTGEANGPSKSQSETGLAAVRSLLRREEPA